MFGSLIVKRKTNNEKTQIEKKIISQTIFSVTVRNAGFGYFTDGCIVEPGGFGFLQLDRTRLGLMVLTVFFPIGLACVTVSEC